MNLKSKQHNTKGFELFIAHQNQEEKYECECVEKATEEEQISPPMKNSFVKSISKVPLHIARNFLTQLFQTCLCLDAYNILLCT